MVNTDQIKTAKYYMYEIFKLLILLWILTQVITKGQSRMESPLKCEIGRGKPQSTNNCLLTAMNSDSSPS